MLVFQLPQVAVRCAQRSVRRFQIESGGSAISSSMSLRTRQISKWNRALITKYLPILRDFCDAGKGLKALRDGLRDR